mgnify:CR=1 FL=1
MARKEFTKTIKVAAIKRATVDNEVYCEACGILTKGRFEIDHVKEDFYGGEPTLENAMVLCVACHREKTSESAKPMAKARRLEAKHVGAARPKGKIQSRGFPKKERRDKLPLPARKGMFYETTETNQED